MVDYYIILTLFILIWVYWIDTLPIKAFKYVRNKLDFKPFNCSFCLSFWLSIVVVIITKDITILGLPLFVKLIENNI